MNLTDNIVYDLINYQKYRKRINDAILDEDMQKIGISYSSLGKTKYGYDIDCIKLGRGDKHLFVVGGTHGSEIIGVDFVSQLIGEQKNIDSFDPNQFTIFFIPLQNPEGFEVTTSSLVNIDNVNFEDKSKEYYLRYRTDSLIYKSLIDLNLFINEHNGVDCKYFLDSLKQFLNSNNNFNLLCEDKAVKNLKLFVKEVNNINSISSYDELRIKLLNICKTITEKFINTSDLNEKFLLYFMSILTDYFSNNYLWDNIKNNKLRLHQEMFKDVGFDNISNNELKNSVISMYKKFNHPLGSQVTFDSTGLGVNLNANTKTNPGIEIINKNITNYRLGVKNNIINYTPGPVGMPYSGDEFNYEFENKVLYNLINKSYKSGNYVGTLLYHGTGGLIFWEPYNDNINEEKYNEYYDINRKMAEIYQNSTGYRIDTGTSNTGYGDLLRRTFPGVLMIELSKMGGNPITPYGDKDNIERCFNENYEAFSNILSYLNYENEKEKIY